MIKQLIMIILMIMIICISGFGGSPQDKHPGGWLPMVDMAGKDRESANKHIYIVHIYL